MMLNPYEGNHFKVTQGFTLGTHNGLDIVGLDSKNLISMCEGVVLQSRIVTDKSNLTWQWGNYVMIQDNNTGAIIVYAHMSKRLVSKGDKVTIGTVVGVEGNTGYSFGSHCHLEVRNSANKVTAKCNTPIYTSIPNKVGTYEVTVEPTPVEDLTESEVKALIAASQEKIYHYWTELPKWAAKPMKAMYDKGYFAGNSPADLMLGQTKMEVYVGMAKILKDKGIISYG